ncbi:hypothetical protein SANT12839_011830 [Streptomyces antimycoticus]|uniref:Uncharacterized protein n=1 Tax=Streptomyces antimycoticus TaxID=68175 RepID=A0A4D4JU80_9ACTN|nr:hypothetical protein SANT12839_011830 [Streptomyces antimycoticus]
MLSRQQPGRAASAGAARDPGGQDPQHHALPGHDRPADLSTPPTAYLSGDDADAKALTTDLLADLGWKPEWIEDLGDITTARATEALVLLVPHVLRRHGLRPFAVSLAR